MFLQVLQLKNCACPAVGWEAAQPLPNAPTTQTNPMTLQINRLPCSPQYPGTLAYHVQVLDILPVSSDPEQARLRDSLDTA